MSYFIMNSGRRIDLATMSVNDLCLEDIAHGLTKVCRFGPTLPLGIHYSVAQHSITLCDYASLRGYSKDVQRALLMHDATESYLGDIVTGLKNLLPCYQELERSLAETIAFNYGLRINDEISAIVKELDTRILLDEANKFMPDMYSHFYEQIPQYSALGVFLIAEDVGISARVKEMFLERCETLGIKD